MQKVLEKFGTPEGHFLVRESRSHDQSFVLSLCHNQRVLNFRSAVAQGSVTVPHHNSTLHCRIVQSSNGSVSLSNPRQGEGGQEVDVEWTADSLEALLETHQTTKVHMQLCSEPCTTSSSSSLQAGLPILLKVNCSPNVTGPIPLIPPERDDTGLFS